MRQRFGAGYTCPAVTTDAGFGPRPSSRLIGILPLQPALFPFLKPIGSFVLPAATAPSYAMPSSTHVASAPVAEACQTVLESIAASAAYAPIAAL